MTKILQKKKNLPRLMKINSLATHKPVALGFRSILGFKSILEFRNVIFVEGKKKRGVPK